MGAKTKIEWTEASWNPLRGCSVVSSGCKNCYAMQVAARFNGDGQAYEGLAYRNSSGAHWTGNVRLIEKHMDDPLRWKRPRRIFVNSMSDLFHESIPDEWIDRIFAVMSLAPQHTFQVLTKRSQRMRDYLNNAETRFRIVEQMPRGYEAYEIEIEADVEHPIGGDTLVGDSYLKLWPVPNVWLGVSCEDQKTADERIPFLLQTPAAVRWISAEPLLGPLILNGGSHRRLEPAPYPKYLISRRDRQQSLKTGADWYLGSLVGLDWVVAGGESGTGARPMHPDWARSIRDQCVTADVPFFFKQKGNWDWLGSHPAGTKGRFAIVDLLGNYVTTDLYPREFARFDACVSEWKDKRVAGRMLDGREWSEYPDDDRLSHQGSLGMGRGATLSS